jgi:exodeoxyribonuclease VII large subunit
VADRRAPTPTAAAAAAVPDIQELYDSLNYQKRRLGEMTSGLLEERREALHYARDTLLRLSPQALLDRYRQRLDDLGYKVLSLVRQRLALQGERLRSHGRQLASLNPQATLERGYSITTRLDTKAVVKRVGQVKKGCRIGVQVADGQFEGTVD